MENTKGHQILQDLLNAFNQNTETVLELFNADATVEYPYAASMGMAARLTMADYRNHLNRMLGQMPDIAFTQIQVYPLQEPDSYWAEFNGQTTVPVTNAVYTQQYVVHFTLRDGKFATYKEYWNVLPVLQTLLGKEDAQRIFNHQQND